MIRHNDYDNGISIALLLKFPETFVVAQELQGARCWPEAGGSWREAPYAHAARCTESGTDITRQFNPPYMLCRSPFRIRALYVMITRISSSATTIATTSRPSDGGASIASVSSTAVKGDILDDDVRYRKSGDTQHYSGPESEPEVSHHAGRPCACSRLVQLPRTPPQMLCTALRRTAQLQPGCHQTLAVSQLRLAGGREATGARAPPWAQQILMSRCQPAGRASRTKPSSSAYRAADIGSSLAESFQCAGLLYG